MSIISLVLGVFGFVGFDAGADGAVNRQGVGTLRCRRCQQFSTPGGLVRKIFAMLKLFVNRVNKGIVAVLAGVDLIVHKSILYYVDSGELSPVLAC